jgi:plastocyanin
MRSILRGVAALGTALALAACSGSGISTTAPTGPAAATGAGATAVASICTEPAAGTATVVSASVQNNTWSQPVTAKVGDVITWTNADAVPHRVALDDGSCTMSANIAGGGSGSLVFSVAGTFPFHCAVHSSMKGTITIS